MIRRIQFFTGLLIFVFATSFGVQAAASVTNPGGALQNPLVADGPMGVWDYEVEGTEDAYRTGTLFVRKENGAPIVEVHLGNGVLIGQDVQVQGNTLKFMLNLDGVERVSVVLNVEKDVILGEVTSSQGSFTIKGTRKLPPQ